MSLLLELSGKMAFFSVFENQNIENSIEIKKIAANIAILGTGVNTLVYM